MALLICLKKIFTSNKNIGTCFLSDMAIRAV